MHGDLDDAPPEVAHHGNGAAHGRNVSHGAAPAAKLPFCSGCGNPAANSSDRFCRGCGKPM